MAGDPWAAAGYVPVTTPSRVAKANADVTLKGAEVEDIPLERAAKRTNIATGQAALAKAPIDKARAGVALDVDTATRDATIRKALAEADSAEFTAKVNALKAKYPTLTAEQTLAGARAMLMEEGDKAYRSAKHYDPGSIRNLTAGALGKLPLAGATLSTLVRDPESQLAVAGQQQFTEGATRSLTGAGLRGDERDFSSSEFYPMPGESAAVKAQKERLRQKYLTQIIQAAGPAYQPDVATTASVPGAPKVGDVVKGYRYKGGAPDRQESWEKVTP